MRIEDRISVIVSTHIVYAWTEDPYLQNDMLYETIRSSHEKMGLGGAKYYLYIDKVMEEQYTYLFKKYVQFIEDFVKANSDINIDIVEDRQKLLRGNWYHMVENCQTPYFLFLEHDWKFIKEIPTEKILDEMDKYERFNYLRLPYTKLGPGEPIHWDEQLGGMFERETEIDLPLTKIAFWSGNPHIAKVSKCKDFYVPTHRQHWSDRTKGTSHLEKELMEVILDDIKVIGKEEAHNKWGCFLYGTWDGFEPVTEHLGDWCRKQ